MNVPVFAGRVLQKCFPKKHFSIQAPRKCCSHLQTRPQVLYVSSSARDTDFTAKLVDVYPNGAASCGRRSLSFRQK